MHKDYESIVCRTYLHVCRTAVPFWMAACAVLQFASVATIMPM
jgi:hypothetical protein